MVLATDYDGTLAQEGRVNAATIDALKEVRSSGRKLILVIGRDLPDLQRVFPQLLGSTGSAAVTGAVAVASIEQARSQRRASRTRRGPADCWS